MTTSAPEYGSSFPTTLSQQSGTAEAIIASAQNNAAVTLSSALNYLNAIVVPEVETNVSASFVIPQDFAAPDVPTAPTPPIPLDLSAIDVPSAPAFPVLVAPTMSDGSGVIAPTAPTMLTFPAPNALDILPPVAPELSIVPLPDAPSFTMPDLPVLLPINLPPPPDIVLPDFLATKPSNHASSSGIQTSVTSMEVKLTALATTVEEQIGLILRDGRGLPAEVEQLMFERARAREDQNGTKLVQEAANEFAARGFMLPPGALAGRIAELRRAAFDKVSSLSRDVHIKAVDTQIDLYKTAMAQGIAYEQVCMEASRATAQFALEAAKATIDIGVRLYEAAVRSYEVDVSAYNVEATVYGERVKAVMAIVQIYNAEIEGQKVIGELNQVNAQVYGEQLKGILVQADIYRAKMDGAKAQIEQNLSRIQAFKALTDAYSSQVVAKKSEYEAWGEANKTNSYIAQSYTAQVQGYAERMRVILSQDQLKLAVYDGGIRNNEGLARQFIAQLESVRTKIQAQSASAESRSRDYSGQATVYASQENVRSSQLNSLVAKYAAQAEVNRGVAQLALAGADASAKNALSHAQIVVSASEGAARAAASMASGAMSAIHAGASSNLSNSISQGLSWSKSAAVSDNNSSN